MAKSGDAEDGEDEQNKCSKRDENSISLRDVVRWGGRQVKEWMQSVKTAFGITENSFSTFTQYGVSGDVLLDLTEQDIRDIGLRQTQVTLFECSTPPHDSI